MKPSANRALPILVTLAVVPAAPAPAQPAGAYPAKPVRLIVPLAPGGPSDIFARTLAQKLTENLKQTVFVDNRPGASAIIGTELAAKSPPDGYTIILVSNTIAINPALFAKLPYDTLRDLAPVSLLATTPYLLAVHPSLPVRSVKELIALAKRRPGELNHASGGHGTGPHLAMEVFVQRTGVKVVHIVYKGGGPAMNDFIAGHTQVYMANMIAALPQVKAGRIRALAVSSERRSEAAPELPTIAESGVPGFNESGQHGILAPAGVPREIIAKLQSEIARALNAPEVKNRLQAEGSRVVASTPEEYGALIRSEMEKWARIVKAAGIRVE
ncbi:MAG TPA: tripartite tricarboxylate transporter substrate binding protein [Burkholderiales bacterium]|nr:tripartite tricarboxylate transporter substrate binding protein [Burkholderiales bacterium]